MPYGRYRMRRRSRKPSRPRLQHCPAEMGGTALTNALGAVRFLAIPNQTAGSSAGTARDGSDRDVEVNTGSVLGKITVNLSVTNATVSGLLEIGIVKWQRQHSLPTNGTAPVFTSAEVLSVGLQQMMRLNAPGWTLKYYEIPFTAETTRAMKFTIDLKKFKMATWRDGDYLSLHIFNRSSATVTINHSARYYEYR